MKLLENILKIAAAAALLAILSACGRGGNADMEADLVFVNDAEATVSAVLLDWQDRSEGAQRADSCPLTRGDSFGFEAGEYPVTVAVYARIYEDRANEPLAALTISEAPEEGARWYVTARDGADGLTLEASADWPEGA